jgi:hypothetical protein
MRTAESVLAKRYARHIQCTCTGKPLYDKNKEYRNGFAMQRVVSEPFFFRLGGRIPICWDIACKAQVELPKIIFSNNVGCPPYAA